MTFAEDVTGEEAKAADEARVTPDEKDGSARCETVKKVATDNLPILFCFGLMARLLALALLRFTALCASVRESHFTRTPEITC